MSALARLARRIRVDPAHVAELVGVAAAVVLALVANVLAERHYRRWDVTTGQRYTLSQATRETLHGLHDPVEIWVLTGPSSAIGQSLEQLLVGYRAESSQLEVHTIDPDKPADLPALEDVRKRFKIEVGRSAEGRVVADSVMVVARGDRHWFVSESDLYEVSQDDAQVKPREEQAITRAIRAVTAGERTKLCFTQGHGEPSLNDASDDGIANLKELLEKDNYEVVAVDTTDPSAHEPFKGCVVAVIASPQGPFDAAEDERLRTYVLGGGNALIATSPINAKTENGMAPVGVDRTLAPFGIGLDDDLVFELDPHVTIPESRGIRFLVTVKPHAVTASLVPGEQGTRDPPRVVVQFARSLHHVTGGDAPAANDLLASSDQSFAVSSIAGAAEWDGIPDKKPSDRSGPLVLAMAAERGKLAASAAHGPRIVVVGTGSVLSWRNWRDPAPVHGAAFFVESAISWLAAKPEVLDVPAKASVAAGIKITDESRSEVRSYVLLFMPLATALLGLAVFFWRRSTERAPRKPASR